MSKYKEIKTRITDIEVLKEAVKENGLLYTQAEEGKTLAATGWGRASRDVNLLIRQRIIAKRSNTGVYGDAGYVWDGTCYALVADDMDMNKVPVRRMFDHIAQTYAVKMVQAKAREKGLVCNSERQRDGSMKLTLVGRN